MQNICMFNVKTSVQRICSWYKDQNQNKMNIHWIFIAKFLGIFNLQLNNSMYVEFVLEIPTEFLRKTIKSRQKVAKKCALKFENANENGHISRGHPVSML